MFPHLFYSVFDIMFVINGFFSIVESLDNDKTPSNNKAVTTACKVCSNDTTLQTDGTCSKKCASRTYQKPYNNECSACPFKNCLECPLGETCTKCENLYKPSSSSTSSSSNANGKCVSACGEGTYHNQGAQECTSCHHLCLTCKGSTKHDCSQCRKKALTLLKRDKRISCVLECPVGYFKQNSLCLPCDAKCAACETSDKCISCNEPYTLEKDSCVAECSEEHYHDQKLNQCIPCSIYLNCSECSQLGGCSKCKPGAYFLNDVCINDCGRGFYVHDKHCVQCSTDHKHCVSCVEDKCLECESGYEISTKPNTCLVKTTTTTTTTLTTAKTTPSTTQKTVPITVTKTTVATNKTNTTTTSQTVPVVANDSTTLTINATMTDTTAINATTTPTTTFNTTAINATTTPTTTSNTTAINATTTPTTTSNTSKLVSNTSGAPSLDNDYESKNSTTKKPLTEGFDRNSTTTNNMTNTTNVVKEMTIQVPSNTTANPNHSTEESKETSESLQFDEFTKDDDEKAELKVEQIQRDFVPAHKKKTRVQKVEDSDDEDSEGGSTFIDSQSEVYSILKNKKKKPKNNGDGGKKYLETLEADEDEVNAALKSLFSGESLLGESTSSDKKKMENALLLTEESLSGESSSKSDVENNNKTSSTNLVSKLLTVDPDIQPKKRSRRGLEAASEDLSIEKRDPSAVTTSSACIAVLIVGMVVIVSVAVLIKRRRHENKDEHKVSSWLVE